MIMVNLRLSAGKTGLYQTVSDDYLVGFVEGEGMFYIGIVPSKETKTGWQVIYFFKVTQNPIGEVVLERLRRRLDCGYIKQNSQSDRSDKSLTFVVRDLSSLTYKVLPFFERKLLIKQPAFEKFKRVLNIVFEKRHLTKEGMTEVLEIAYSMNTQKRRVNKEAILKAYKN